MASLWRSHGRGNDGCLLGANANGSCRGSRALPDYVSVDVSYYYATPIFAGPEGGGSVTVTRSGQVYGGLHLGAGIGGGASLRGGNVLPEEAGAGRAAECEIDRFVNGWSGFASADSPGWSQGLTANQNGVAAELGVAAGAGASVNHGYNVPLFDLGDGW